jgi:hypothetical protein
LHNLVLLDLSVRNVQIRQSLLDYFVYKVSGLSGEVLNTQFGGCLKGLPEEQNDLPRVNVGLLEILDHVVKVELLEKVDPTGVEVELLYAGLEINASLILLDQKQFFGLLNPSS